jgi:Nucleotidyltransferase substrate binding protein like
LSHNRLDMLGKRNLLTHTYDEALAMESYRLIRQDFSPELKKLVQWFQECKEHEEN